MASFSGPNINNRIADDVPAIRELLTSLAKLAPDDGNTDLPNGAKRLVEGTSGYAFQSWNGTAWVTLERWNINVQQVDGYSAATGTTAGTIPVRDESGKIEGDITGNAATATSAEALSAVNPVAMGGTGASTAANARSNLGVPPTSHASSGTTYGVSTATKYGHAKASGTTPKADADGGSVGAETASFARGDHAHAKVYGSPTTAGDVFVTDSANVNNTAEGHYAVSPKALAEVKSAAESAQDSANKCLPLTGGTMTGTITFNQAGQALKNAGDDGMLRFDGGSDWNNGAFLRLYGINYDSDKAGRFELVSRSSTTGKGLVGCNDGRLQWESKNVVRSVNNLTADIDGNVAFTGSIRHGTNNFVPAAGDTVAGWEASQNNKTEVYWYNSIVLSNQPTRYGHLISTVNGQEISQIFVCAPNGYIFTRAGNNEGGWNGNNGTTAIWFPGGLPSSFTAAKATATPNVGVYYIEKNAVWTCPSGGSWAYHLHATGDGWGYVGSCAGGTQITNDSGHVCIGIAIRIA